MSSQFGRLTVSFERLAALIGVPRDHVITAVVPASAENIAGRTVDLIVSGPSLPQHCEGAPVVHVGIAIETSGRSYFT